MNKLALLQDYFNSLNMPGVLKATAPWALGGAAAGGALGAVNYAMEDPEKQKHDSILQSMGLGAALGGVGGAGIKAMAGLPFPGLPGPQSLNKANLLPKAPAQPGVMDEIKAYIAEHPLSTGAGAAVVGKSMDPAWKDISVMGGGKKLLDAAKSKNPAMENLNNLNSVADKPGFGRGIMDTERGPLDAFWKDNPNFTGPLSPELAARQQNLNRLREMFIKDPASIHAEMLSAAEQAAHPYTPFSALTEGTVDKAKTVWKSRDPRALWNGTPGKFQRFGRLAAVPIGAFTVGDYISKHLHQSLVNSQAQALSQPTAQP